MVSNSHGFSMAPSSRWPWVLHYLLRCNSAWLTCPEGAPALASQKEVNRTGRLLGGAGGGNGSLRARDPRLRDSAHDQSRRIPTRNAISTARRTSQGKRRCAARLVTHLASAAITQRSSRPSLPDSSTGILPVGQVGVSPAVFPFQRAGRPLPHRQDACATDRRRPGWR